MSKEKEHIGNGVSNRSSQNDGYLPYPKGFATASIHHGQEAELWNSMAVVAPIVMSTTFKQYGPADTKKYEYGRSGNPTREVLEDVLAKLDNATYGLAFASGLGAITAVFGMLKSGDNIIVGDDVYGGTNRLFNRVVANYNIDVTMVDLVDIRNLEKAIKPTTKLIWIETPTNPTLKVIDIRAASEIAKRNNIVLAVDNTFLTPYLQRPLDLGADLVVYSLTKYMNGHSDVIMGSISTSNQDLYEKLKFLQNAMGIVPSPFDCSQVNRSLKTLALRMQQHQRAGMEIAVYLKNHPQVEKVIHPGLECHPQHLLHKQQTSGQSGVFSFYLKGGLEQSKKFLSSLKIFTLAESLGGYESLAELPSVMTHASVPPEQRKVLGISDNLIRLSVGLEDVEDLIADLEQAFRSIK
nr:putative cystathionine gamma-lyase 2 [Leptinotarsa decemlineata]